MKRKLLLWGWLMAGLGFSLTLGVRASEAPVERTNEVANAVGAAAISTPSEPWLTFGLNRVEWLHSHQWLGNPLWQYVAFLIYVFLAFYASKLLDRVVLAQLKRLAAKTKTSADDMLVAVLAGPVKVVAFVILLHIGLRVFAWPDWAALFISNALKIIVATSITYVVLKFVDLGLKLWKRRAEQGDESVLDLQLFPILSRSLKIFVVVVAVLVTSQNLGMNITGLLASLSIGGLALGLAAQDTLANMFGAVAIFADKPFRVGDRIQLDGVDGPVESIGLRSTRVRNLDGHLVTIPNKTMANASITNISKRPTIKTVMNLGLTYDTPVEQLEKALKIIQEIYGQHPMTADLVVAFDKFADSSLNVLVVHWWKSTNYKAYLVGLQSLNLALKQRFDAEGISFAFPSRTLYLKQDGDWKVTNWRQNPPANPG